jgi:hypothetical protein
MSTNEHERYMSMALEAARAAGEAVRIEWAKAQKRRK